MPIWRRFRPYGLLMLLALPALWPLSGAGLPRTNDALPHFYRAGELARLWQAGVLLPRWAPDLVWGLGYPVFNFFPYEAHGLIAGLNLLGLPLLTAYHAATGLTLLLALLGAYHLGRTHFGPLAGLVGGVAYLYSPYLLYDVYIRGSLPEALALAWLPWALLALRQAARGEGRPAGGWPGALGGGAALAAAILAHQGVMLQALPFVAAYSLWQWLAGPGRAGGWRGLARALTPYALALGLAAFFLLPALAEARYVQIERGTANGAMAYGNNFLSLRDLLAYPRLPVDPDLLNPPVVRALPVAALLLAAAAGARLWRGPAARRAGAGWLLLALGALLLMLPVARPVWEALPLLQLTLFPWRLLGPVALFTAMAGGAAFAAEPEATAREARWDGLAALALGALVVLGLPFASPPREAVPAAPTPADLAAFETPPDFIGTTTVGEYLPIWVKPLPDTSADRAALMAGRPPVRFDAPGAAVTQTHEGAFTLSAAAPVTFTYRSFYFPGWAAALDGAAVAITPTVPAGLMAVAAPAGTHTLTFTYAGTPIQAAAGWLSAGVAVGMAGAVLWLWRRDRSTRSANDPAASHSAEARAAVLSAPLWAAAIGLALARPLLYDAGLTPLLRPGLAAASERGVGGLPPLNRDVADELTLLSAGVTPAIGGDQAAALTLYWRANHPLGVAYGFDVRLVDAAGRTWSEPAMTRPTDWRFAPGTDRWPVNQYILDAYLLTVLPGTPPGDYTAQVTVFAYYNLQAIATIPIGLVQVTTPTRARLCADEAAVAVAGPLDLRLAASNRAGAVPGDDVTLTLCWQVTSLPAGPVTATLALLDASGQQRASRTFAPGAPYPAGDWATGDPLRDQVTVRLPADLATGTYTWMLAVGAAPSVTLGALAVTAPERTFEPPAQAELVDADLGPATLAGRIRPDTAPTSGNPAALTLVWRADDLMDVSYHVFVHLLAADGTLAAQSDGVPVDWTRPTTGWLPGEYVLDVRALPLPADLPPGDYALWAGLYDPATNERLATDEFPDGRVPLGALRVAAP
ncbi:MAG: hypothetical protein IT317_10505 [Anaerolineales bacterium]|nr:hypothetical protein [Anaerolineales bacterium]